MSIKERETDNINRFRLAGQGPSSGKCSQKGNIGCHQVNPVISKQRKRCSQENRIVMECYLLSEPKVRGYRKCILSFWLSESMFWVSKQQLVDQANTICRISWMTELEIEELERNLAETDSCKEEEKNTDDTDNNLGEEVRYFDSIGSR